MTAKTKGPMPVFRVLTYNWELEEFTPQTGVPSIAVGLPELAKILRALQEIGYSCHRIGGHPRGDSDPSVLVERVNGPSRAEGKHFQ